VESRAPSLEIRLLGPVELRIDGDKASIGGSRQRRLLALLALRPGQVIPADELIEEVWSGEPTDGADTTLRSYVSRLRRSLDGRAAIDRTDRGYVLGLAPAAVDALEFERLVREGSEALAQGAIAAARERLVQGLGLWRGHAFGDASNDGALRIAAERLEELRLLALERRIEADLELGGGSELVDELEALVREHPFRERLWRHLMLALYRADRQGDALAAYHRARRSLDEELGIEPGEELQQLEAAILRHEVPPARPGAAPSNLPASLSTFVGRTREVEEVTVLVGLHRLVTLTGVGGVGKTRLAIEVARRRLAEHPDGTYFVDLAPIADASHVTSAVATALGVQQQPRQSPTETLVAFLRQREVLLILDNCEHLLDAVAELAAALLEEAPKLRILATSREVLGVDGEADVAVPPMALVAVNETGDETRSEAVQLFLERVDAARPGFVPDAEALAIAAQICRDLDGLPLALELAASRARALSIADIGRHLEDRFRFLVSWRRVSAARHRTLREAMDWSYALLAPAERDLLARIAVFPGGFTLDAAEAISEESAATLDGLQRLVEASLVIVDTAVAPTRYRLLETVRQYGLDQLGDRRDRAEASLTAWVLALVTSAIPDSTKPIPPDAYERFDREMDNIRAALRFAAADPDPEVELTIGSLIWRYWWVRGLLREGRAVSEGAIQRRGTVRTVPGARTLRAAASLAWAMGDFDEARAMGRRALQLAEEIGDVTEQMSANNVLAVIARSKDEFTRAAAHFERAIELAEADDNVELVNMYRGNLGSVYIDLERHDEARALFEAVLEYRAPLGPSEHAAVTHLNLGQLELQVGQLDIAEGHFTAALEGFQFVGFKARMANAMQGLAAVEARTGRAEAAARRLGGAAAVIGGTGWATGDSPLERAAVEAAREALGDEAFERLFHEGLRGA
jgi:predicted ATPase/DNA-binding SARP family transcriptional activator